MYILIRKNIIKYFVYVPDILGDYRIRISKRYIYNIEFINNNKIPYNLNINYV